MTDIGRNSLLICTDASPSLWSARFNMSLTKGVMYKVRALAKADGCYRCGDGIHPAVVLYQGRMPHGGFGPVWCLHRFKPLGGDPSEELLKEENPYLQPVTIEEFV